MAGFLSKLTLSIVGLGSKALLRGGFCSSVTVKGMDNLIRALESDERNRGRGIVTSECARVAFDSYASDRVLPVVSNHISTWVLRCASYTDAFTQPWCRLDDPVAWGVLPTRFYRDSRRIRWTLGASDIMFTNP